MTQSKPDISIFVNDAEAAIGPADMAVLSVEPDGTLRMTKSEVVSNPDAAVSVAPNGEFTPIDPALDIASVATNTIADIVADESDGGYVPRRVFAPDDHGVKPAAPAPQRFEEVLALPRAMFDEDLYEVDDLPIAAFKDRDDEVRHVYLNALGYYVKA